jgi:hypothetical protein
VRTVTFTLAVVLATVSPMIAIGATTGVIVIQN